jgi:tetratricopeptide (TPR) repeat protein
MRKFLAVGLANVRTSMVSAFLCLFLSCGSPQIIAQDMPEGSETFRQASEAMRRGDLNAAGEGFAATTKASPAFAEAHFNLGLVREEQGRFEEAIGSLQKALSLKPHLHGANLFLGVAYYRMNRFTPALAAVNKETATYPKDASAWMWLGVIQLARDRPEDAAAALDQAAKLAPDNVDILYHRGQAHLLVSKNSYGKMFKTDPKSWRVHQVLAQANSEADRPLDAIAEYQAAIKLAPQQPGLHEELASEYSKAGKSEEAEAELRQELDIDPHSAVALYKLGILQVEAGEVRKGKAAIETALQERPGLKNSTYYLGRAEMILGNNDVAAERFKQTISLDSDPELIEQSWYQLAIVYRKLHRNDEAQKALATFQRLKDENAERQQQRLEKNREAQDQIRASPSNPPKEPDKN